MTVKAHKLVYIGQGAYRCANCGRIGQKSDMGTLLIEDCPSFPESVDYFPKLAEISEALKKQEASLAEIKSLTASIDAKLELSSPI
jgi:hypothetical protein